MPIHFAVITVLLLAKPGYVHNRILQNRPLMLLLVAYWGRPRVALFGPEEEAFNKNVHESGSLGMT